MKINISKLRNRTIDATVKVLNKAKYTMPTHPLDNPEFRDWYKEQDGHDDMAYGIYDSKWAELYEQFKDAKESDNA